MRCSCAPRPVLLLVLLFALVAGKALSQGRFTSMGGANFTRMADPLGVDHGPQTGHSVNGIGYVLGVGYEPMYQQPWGICVEALFAQRSAGYFFDEIQAGYPPNAVIDGMDRGQRTMQCRVVEVPAMLVYRGWQGLRLELGAYASYLLHATDIKRGTRMTRDGDIDLDERVDRTSSLTPWEFGGTAGALIEGPRHLHMDLRYKTGFTNLDMAVGSSPSYTRQFQIMLVYSFATGGRALSGGPN